MLYSMRRCEPHRLEGLELLSTALWHLKDDVQLCYLARDAVSARSAVPGGLVRRGGCLSLQKGARRGHQVFSSSDCGSPSVRLRVHAVRPRVRRGSRAAENFSFSHRAMYRHAMRLDGRHYNAWYGLGAIYYRQEKYAWRNIIFSEHCHESWLFRAALLSGNDVPCQQTVPRRAPTFETRSSSRTNNPQARFSAPMSLFLWIDMRRP